MSDGLVLSLGHNSSAILIRDGRILSGYETERLSGVKSDSRFPRLPIEEIHRRHVIRPDTGVFVSHWQLHGNLNENLPKHWDGKYISELCPSGQMFSVNPYFTHHDAHAWSAVLFAGDSFPCATTDESFLVVMDGFGTYGEHMSLYRYVKGIPILLERKYGFGSSLGLLYQYTTAFLGMKQNQDEYKLLAYEAHIDEVTSINRSALDEAVQVFSELYISRVSSYMTQDSLDPMLNLGALPNTAKQVADMLSGVLASSCSKDLSEWEKRVVIAFFTQSVVQNVAMAVIFKYSPQNVILVGGLFLNVKLNNLISNNVPGLTCIMPLAGDQGAGLGLYKALYQDFEWGGDLFWGDRTLESSKFEAIENLLFEQDEDKAFQVIGNELEANMMVNVVRGAMEFGPRALCHTTTLALPNPDTAAHVNNMNERTNEMPFAPVMTAEQAGNRLKDCHKIHKSLEYMICTRDFVNGAHVDMMGAAHKYPEEARYSARPQITSDPQMVKLLHNFGPLINTSFNFHGVPIVWNDQQIRNTHMLEQMAADFGRQPLTVVIGGKS